MEGFRNNRDDESDPYANDKLSLLKSNNKYKDTSPNKFNGLFDSQEDSGSFSNDI